MVMIVHRESLPKNAEALLTLRHTCSHCGSPVVQSQHELAQGESEKFCCRGCEKAWELIHELNLGQFYKQAQAVPLRQGEKSDFSIFDAPEFQKSFVESTKSSKAAQILIEGVTCFACVWLIKEAIRRRIPTANISLNQATGVGVLTWDEKDTRLSEIVSLIEKIGYQVHPYHGQSLKEDYAHLVRVGVGLFLMVNVMSFALVEYLTGSDGLDPSLEQFFRSLSAGLTTIALAVPGREFFLNTFRSFKSRAPNIDAPILVALVAGYLYSLYNTFVMRGDVFFDTICAVIAFVTTGRYIQSLVLKRNQNKFAALLKPRDGFALVRRDHQFLNIPTHQIRAGDVLRILPGEIFPVLAKCYSGGCGEFSLGELKGEPEWQTIKPEGAIPSGAVNGGSAVDVYALEEGPVSYTAQIKNLIAEASEDKGVYQKWSDQAAWLLFMVVLSAAAVTFVTLAQSDLPEAVRRSVAVLLVACPCTFAIGVPLTFGTAMTQALSAGIMFRSQRVLEQLAMVRTFIFDKTGTLTLGQPIVRKVQWVKDLSQTDTTTILNVLASLGRQSSHHVAQSISIWARGSGGISCGDIRSDETQGEGLKLTLSQIKGAHKHTLLLGRQSWLKSQGVEVSSPHGDYNVFAAFDGGWVASFVLDDELRNDAKEVIDSLKIRGLTTKILSGDSESRTQSVGRSLGISSSQVMYEATPLSKSDVVREGSTLSVTAMVGNGLNDSVAMATSCVGIAVAGSSGPAHSSADICLMEDRLTDVVAAWDISRAAVLRMRIAFGFAAFYNVIGLTLAVAGQMTPMAAAILMPISSLTITAIATRWSVAIPRKA